MTTRRIDELRQDDRIRFPSQRDDHRVTKSEWYSESMGLWELNLRGHGAMDHIRAYPDMQVTVTHMVREIEVPCRAARHGDEPVRMLHDFAKGPAPQAMICGNCDDEITAEVVAQMKRPEPKRGDKVIFPDPETHITGFDEDAGTRLNSGAWVCVNRFVYLAPNTWKFMEERS